MLRTANNFMILLTAVVVIAQFTYWYGRLPDSIPSHFDGNGQIDGEMSKAAFFALMGGFHAMFLIGFPILGRQLRRVPDSAINLPNKEYWLAPDRRDQTLAKNSAMLNATGWMTSWLMIGIIQLTALVAIKTRDTISPEFGWLMAIYLIAIFAIVGLVLHSFRLPKTAVSDSSGNPQRNS